MAILLLMAIHCLEVQGFVAYFSSHNLISKNTYRKRLQKREISFRDFESFIIMVFRERETFIGYHQFFRKKKFKIHKLKIQYFLLSFYAAGTWTGWISRHKPGTDRNRSKQQNIYHELY